MFILTDWEKFSETKDQWLWLGVFQLVHYRIFLKIKCHFLQNLISKFFWIIIFGLICPKTKSATVTPNYSQSIKINFGPSDAKTIVQSTHPPTVSYWRLSEFCTARMIKPWAIKTWYFWKKSHFMKPNCTSGMYLILYSKIQFTVQTNSQTKYRDNKHSFQGL